MTQPHDGSDTPRAVLLGRHRVTDLPALRREDGSVVVPVAIAGEVLRLLARALLDDARVYGGRPSPAARALITALYDAAQHQPNDPDPPAPAGACSVAEAALLMGCHPSWVRHLLAHGRLAGRRSGGVWLVDLPLAISLASRAAA